MARIYRPGSLLRIPLAQGAGRPERLRRRESKPCRGKPARSEKRRSPRFPSEDRPLLASTRVRTRPLDLVLFWVRREGAHSPAGGSPARGIVDAPRKPSGGEGGRLPEPKPRRRRPLKGGRASAQAATRVKPEQVPRGLTWAPTRPKSGEGRSARWKQSTKPGGPPG
jgi:hypothetical protein